MNDINIKILLLKLVSDINYEIFELLQNTELEYNYLLEFYDNGCDFGIKFLNYFTIFDTIHDFYENDKGECLITEQYIKDRIKTFITDINKITRFINQ